MIAALNDGGRTLPPGERFEIVILEDGNLFVKPLDTNVHQLKGGR